MHFLIYSFPYAFTIVLFLHPCDSEVSFIFQGFNKLSKSHTLRHVPRNRMQVVFYTPEPECCCPTINICCRKTETGSWRPVAQPRNDRGPQSLSTLVHLLHFNIRILKLKVKGTCSKPKRFFYSSVIRHRLVWTGNEFWRPEHISKGLWMEAARSWVQSSLSKVPSHCKDSLLGRTLFSMAWRGFWCRNSWLSSETKRNLIVTPPVSALCCHWQRQIHLEIPILDHRRVIKEKRKSLLSQCRLRRLSHHLKDEDVNWIASPANVWVEKPRTLITLYWIASSGSRAPGPAGPMNVFLPVLWGLGL